MSAPCPHQGNLQPGFVATSSSLIRSCKGELSSRPPELISLLSICLLSILEPSTYLGLNQPCLPASLNKTIWVWECCFTSRRGSRRNARRFRLLNTIFSFSSVVFTCLTWLFLDFIFFVFSLEPFQVLSTVSYCFPFTGIFHYYLSISSPVSFCAVLDR